MQVSTVKINQEIDFLESEWRKHRLAAISRNEPPQGFNRQQADRLEMRIHSLKRQQQKRPNQTHYLWKALGLLAYCTLIAGCIRAAHFQSFVKALFTPAIPAQAQGKLRLEKPAQAPSFKQLRKEIIPTVPANPDPALAMQKRFFGSKLGGSFAALDEGFTNYQRLSGTLARIQVVSLRRQSLVYQLPTVWINRTREDCFNQRSIGVYSPQCQVIKLDYSDGFSAYEHSTEMEVTLAHEWGHHLISLSGVAMSPTEQEVVSDCFAGAVFGYYVKHGLIDFQDATHAIALVQSVGNNSPNGHHPNRETRVRSFAGGLFSVADPSHPKGQEFMGSCPSLHQIIDVAKIREMGLNWES